MLKLITIGFLSLLAFCVMLAAFLAVLSPRPKGPTE